MPAADEHYRAIWLLVKCFWSCLCCLWYVQLGG